MRSPHAIFYTNLIAKIRCVSIVCLLPFIASVVLGQTSSVTSAIFGYSQVSIPAGGRVVAPVFVKPPLYAGYTAVSGNTLSASGLTANAFAPTALVNAPNYPTCYLEITDTNSAYQGQIFDVAANTTNSITVYGFPSALTGVTNLAVTVRRHTTLGSLATASKGLTSYSDVLTVYNNNNSHSPYYYTSSGIVGADYFTVSDQVVIYPGSAVLINALASSSVLWSGEVKTGRTIVPIYNGENLVAPLDPRGGTLLGALNLAASLLAYSDVLSLVSANGNFSTTTFYSDGSNLLDQNYSVLTASNTPIVAVGNGFIINSVGTKNWTNQQSF